MTNPVPAWVRAKQEMEARWDELEELSGNRDEVVRNVIDFARVVRLPFVYDKLILTDPIALILQALFALAMALDLLVLQRVWLHFGPSIKPEPQNMTMRSRRSGNSCWTPLIRPSMRARRRCLALCCLFWESFEVVMSNVACYNVNIPIHYVNAEDCPSDHLPCFTLLLRLAATFQPLCLLHSIITTEPYP